MHVLEIEALLIRLGALPLKYILSSLLHPSKQLYPKEVTDEEIVIEVKTRQFSKQDCPNEVTDEGIVMEVNPLQPEKHKSPNEVTDEGIVMEVKPLQWLYLLLVDYQYYTL